MKLFTVSDGTLPSFVIFINFLGPLLDIALGLMPSIPNKVKERLVVCKSVIAHLKARKETRWRGFGQNMDYPGTKDDWDKKAVNSVYENGKIKILFRDLTQTPDFGQKGGTL